MTVPRLTRMEQLVYEMIFDAADQGEPAPTTTQMVDGLGSNKASVNRRLKALRDLGLIIEEQDPEIPFRRRFYVKLLDRWTGYASRKNAQSGTRRLCIVYSCKAAFISQGAHHRMCGRCRIEVADGVTDTPSRSETGRVKTSSAAWY